jgi:enoyl-CoA hydratase
MDIMDKEILIDEPDKNIRIITINRIKKRNALSNELIIEIANHLTNFQKDKNIRCIIITGSKGFFSAGSDITEMSKDGFKAINNELRNKSWEIIENFEKPIICCVDGFCIGAGLELMLLCDLIISSKNSKFGSPEINIGIMPGDGASQRLTKITGKYISMKMFLTGEPVPSDILYNNGVISEISERPLDRSIEIAKIICQKSPISVQMIKKTVNFSYNSFLLEGLKFERDRIAETFNTLDQKEGMKAFLEKRTPNYKGE